GEAVSAARRRGDLGTGVAPRTAGGAAGRAAVRVACVLGMAMAVVRSGRFGRGFGGASTDQKSCGEKSYRRARLGYISQCRIFRCQHILVPQESIATYVASGTPVPF